MLTVERIKDLWCATYNQEDRSIGPGLFMAQATHPTCPLKAVALLMEFLSIDAAQGWAGVRKFQSKFDLPEHPA